MIQNGATNSSPNADASGGGDVAAQSDESSALPQLQTKCVRSAGFRFRGGRLLPAEDPAPPAANPISPSEYYDSGEPPPPPPAHPRTYLFEGILVATGGGSGGGGVTRRGSLLSGSGARGGGGTATIWGSAQFWEDVFCGKGPPQKLCTRWS